MLWGRLWRPVIGLDGTGVDGVGSGGMYGRTGRAAAGVTTRGGGVKVAAATMRGGGVALVGDCGRRGCGRRAGAAGSVRIGGSGWLGGGVGPSGSSGGGVTPSPSEVFIRKLRAPDRYRW